MGAYGVLHEMGRHLAGALTSRECVDLIIKRATRSDHLLSQRIPNLHFHSLVRGGLHFLLVRSC